MKSNDTQTRVERVEEETIQDALSDPQRVQTLDTLLSRRNVLRGLSGGTLALMAGAALTGAEQSAEAGPAGVGRTRDTNLDIQILNFALHAEYLEGEFYTYAFTGQGMAANGIDVTGVDGNGNAVPVGPTAGGAKINFTDAGVQSVGNNIWQDELKHIAFIRSTITQLGGKPIAKPPQNLAALAAQLGIDPASQANFLIGGRSFCDTGTSAYCGTSKYLTNATVIEGAARILAVEAFHAGALRLQIAQQNITAPTLDSLDVPPPPATANYFTVDQNAFAISRSARQVLNILFLTPNSTSSTSGGFYPQGVYGNIATLEQLV